MGGSGRVMETERRRSMGLAGNQESLAQRYGSAGLAAITQRCRERKRGPKEEEEVEGARATPAADPPKARPVARPLMSPFPVRKRFSKRVLRRESHSERFELMKLASDGDASCGRGSRRACFVTVVKPSNGRTK